MDYDTPSFSFLHISFHQIFFHRITQSYRNILAPRIFTDLTLQPLANAVAFQL